MSTSASLRITEIFHSLQGESRTVGYPTVFVRLTGCPLRCGYCDSEYAFHGGEKFTVEEVIAKVASFGAVHVCVTGGEPLAQPNAKVLLAMLAEAGYEVSLETSGAIDIADIDSRINVVMDLKTPDSGEMDKNLYANIDVLKPIDQIKFVLCSRKDYEWAKFKIDEYSLADKASDVLLSPSYEQLDPRELADWIVEDKLNVRFQLQLHKQLWGDKPGV